MAQVGHAIGGDLPEMRVEHLERDVAVVADPRQVVDDRPELEVALAGQDPVGVAGQLARGAAQVADLHPGQVRAVTGTPGPRTCSDRCSNGTRRGRRPALPAARLRDQGQRRLEAGAERRRLLKLERDPHAERRGQLGGLAERGGGPGDSRRRPARGTKSAATISVGTPSSCKQRRAGAGSGPSALRARRPGRAATLPETPPRPA